MKLIFLFLAFISHGLCGDSLPGNILFDIPQKAIDLMPLNAAYIACTDEKFSYCQYQFNQFIGYDGAWNDPVALETHIYSKYKQDVQGLLQLCHARTQLYQCFGTEYESCTSRIQFIKKGANSSNAYQISGVFQSLDFECSGGVFQATQHWDCIYNTWQDPSYQNTRNACVTAFYTNPLNSFQQVCLAGQTLAKCLQLAFVAAKPPCNTYVDLNWFECERVVNMFQFDGNCPSLTCQVIQVSKNEESAPEMTLREAIQQQVGNVVAKARAKLYKPSHGHEKDNFDN